MSLDGNARKATAGGARNIVVIATALFGSPFVCFDPPSRLICLRISMKRTWLTVIIAIAWDALQSEFP
jgi:hypothetical protein